MNGKEEGAVEMALAIGNAAADVDETLRQVGKRRI
jgi:hypothetical protein